MNVNYPPPTDWPDFQRLCVRYFRQCHGYQQQLTVYGRHGQKQYGIDLRQTSGAKPWIAVQCKLKDKHRTLSKSEIRDDVATAENADLQIATFIVATTAPNQTQLIDLAAELNSRPEKQFDVRFIFWDEISDDINALGFLEAWAVYDPQIRRELDATIAGLASASIATDPADSSYESINDLLDKNRIDAAEYAIDELADPTAATVHSDKQCYGYLRIKARLAFAKGAFKEAGDLFVQAYDFAPTVLAANLNRILGLSLQGNSAVAFAEVVRLISEGKSSKVLAERLVEVAPSLADLAPYEDLIETYSSDSENLNAMLAHLSLRCEDISRAEKSAKMALKIAPDSPHAKFALGAVHHQRIVLGLSQSLTDDKREALQLYAEAAEEARRLQYAQLVPEILVNRARLHAAFNEGTASVNYAKEAVVASNTKPQYAAEAVRCCLRFEKYNDAETVSLTMGSDPESKMLREIVAFHTAVDEPAKRLAIENLKTIREGEALFNAVGFALEIDDVDLAASCVTPDFNARNSFLSSTLLAWIALERKNETEAGNYADVAIKAVSNDCHESELDVLLSILVGLKRFDEALPLAERLYTPGLFDSRSRRLIVVASNAAAHGVLIRVYGELAATDSLPAELKRAAFKLLMRYDPDAAFQMAIDEGSHGDNYFQTAANYVATVRQEPHKFGNDVWKLPAVEGFPITDISLVTAPLIKAGRYHSLIDFTYRYLRSHFEDHEAHHAYFIAVAMHAEKAKIEVPEEVTRESAILLRGLRDGTERWVVLENDNPRSTLLEVDPDSSPFGGLIGRRKGAVVQSLSGGAIETPEEIVEILHKWTYRAKDVGDRFHERFPGSSMLQRFSLDKDGELDIDALLQMGEKNRSSKAAVFNAYMTHSNLTINAVAKALGCSYLKAFESVLDHDVCPLQCAPRNEEEFGKAVEVARTAESCVLDLSAILTVSRLTLWERIPDAVQLIVPHSVVAEIEAWEDRIPNGETALDHQSDTKRLSRFVKSCCEVVDTLGVAAISGTQRTAYEQAIGPSNADSAFIAQLRGLPLWTDELTTGLLAASELRVGHCWTQAVLQAWLRRGHFSQREFDIATAWLVSWKYQSSQWSAGTMLAAASESQWDRLTAPFQCCLAVLKTSRLGPTYKATMMAQIFSRLSKSSCPQLMRTEVIRAFLRGWGDRLMAAKMRDSAEQVFGPDVVWAAEIADNITYWLEYDPSPY